MKRFLAILIALQFLLLSFGGFRALTQYVLYHDYIAEQLCVKKEIKDNDCQGRCHMLKQMEQSEEETSLQFGFKLYELLVIESLDVEVAFTLNQYRIELFKPILEGIVRLFEGKIFHPPRVSSAC